MSSNQFLYGLNHVLSITVARCVDDLCFNKDDCTVDCVSKVQPEQNTMRIFRACVDSRFTSVKYENCVALGPTRDAKDSYKLFKRETTGENVANELLTEMFESSEYYYLI